ncbi:MAG TPA: SDR family NAD(P)-dependent oxidoreductase [Streptosporangiaceae bacterium]|nr:SDR family NAD(P)-dependent oxidoreductase [Streptosporangiaceae bacterium]
MGAGAAGQALLRALRHDATADVTPVGILDDNDILFRVCGLPVLGGTDTIGRAAARTGARVMLLAIPSLPPTRAADLIERSWAAGLAVRTLHPGGCGVRDLRDMRLSQVLGRDEIAVGGKTAGRLVADRRVLVTGAGGAIGSALCRRLMAQGPAMLCMVDHDPAALDRLGLEIGGLGGPASERTMLVRADVRDRDAITAVFEEVRPALVFHAAQRARPGVLERDPCAAVLTNVRGTRYVVEAAVRCGVERLTLISTDAAADPASVFGATKRLAELVTQSHAGGATRFAAVRLGEVVGAPGSPMSALAGRMVRNQVITIAHPDLARRFMTVEESAGLVLEAAGLATVAETFALDVGRPVPVVDAVHRYAERLRVPAVSIRFGGLGPGERLAARPFAAAERPLPTAHPKVLATGPAPVPAAAPLSGPLSGPAPAPLPRLMDSLCLVAARGDEEATRVMLRRLLPEYRPAVRHA